MAVMAPLLLGGVFWSCCWGDSSPEQMWWRWSS